MGVRTVYVEFGRGRVPFTWNEGRVLDDDERAAQEDVHRRFARVVAEATVDKRSPTLRAVRAGSLLLVETGLDDGDTESRADASILISRPARTNWRSAAAEVAAVLRDAGVPVHPDRLRAAFAAAWRQTRPPFIRFAIPGAAVLLVLLWRLATARRRRHRNGARPGRGES